MKLWIDTDCGVDDSTAILISLFSKNTEILGISCIGGNVSCDQVTLNVRRTLKAFGKEDIPVYKGCERALISEPRHIPEIHGQDGLGDIDYDAFGIRDVVPMQEENAVFKLVEVLKENEDIELLTLGPLTNIALAMHIAPEIKKNIKHIMCMGGADNLEGNTTKFAEFNFFCDPEAAAIVLREFDNTKITLCTWNLTMKHAIKGEAVKDFFLRKETYLQRFVGATWHLPIEYDGDQALMADPIASFLCMQPDAIKKERIVKIEIPLSGEQRGATICTDVPSGVHIVTEFDLEQYVAYMRSLLLHH